MSDLKKQLIKLGSTNPELRPHIRPILDKVALRREDTWSNNQLREGWMKSMNAVKYGLESLQNITIAMGKQGETGTYGFYKDHMDHMLTASTRLKQADKAWYATWRKINQ